MPYSDLDIVLKGTTKIPFVDLTKLLDCFSESSLTFKVELVDWNRITPEFRAQIKKSWIRLI